VEKYTFVSRARDEKVANIFSVGEPVSELYSVRCDSLTEYWVT